MADENNFGAGQQQPSDSASPFNQINFMISQALWLMRTAMLVQVKAVTNSGGVEEVGYVDIQPMVNQVDGLNNSTPHGTIYHIPYFRLQGGTNAIILDPQVGDIGIAIFADRDISSVKATKKISNPGSARRMSMADGLYIGGVLNGVPTQYVEFSAAGIRIHSPTLVKLDAPDVQIVAPTVEITASTSVTMTTPILSVSGNANVGGTINAGGNITGGSISLDGHGHTGVQPGSGTSGPPV